MIIWSRWGILTFLAFGLSVGCALPLMTALGMMDAGVIVAAVVFAFATGFNALLALFVYPRLDRPRQVTYSQPLPQPIRHPNGVVQTHQVLPALDQNGQPLWTRPRSSLFFIPGTVWWMVCLALTIVFGVASIVTSITG